MVGIRNGCRNQHPQTYIRNAHGHDATYPTETMPVYTTHPPQCLPAGPCE